MNGICISQGVRRCVVNRCKYLFQDYTWNLSSNSIFCRLPHSYSSTPTRKCSSEKERRDPQGIDSRVNTEHSTGFCINHNLKPKNVITKPVSGVFMKSKVNKHRITQTKTDKTDFAFKNDLLETEREYHESRHSAKQCYKEKIDNYGLSGPGKRQRSKKAKILQNISGEILFGIHPILLALQQKRRKIYKLYIKENLYDSDKESIQEILHLCKQLNILTEWKSLKVLDELSLSRPHQGVCMDVGHLTYQPYVEESCRVETPLLWLVMDQVQDPMNFGAMLRSAYYLGVDKVLAVTNNSSALSPVVSKASAGVLELLPIFGVEDLSAFLRTLAGGALQWDIVGTTGSVANDADKLCGKYLKLSNFRLHRNTILILGNEGKGITPEAQQFCTHMLTIPAGRGLPSGVDSLNVSVATGILLYGLQQSRMTP